jgi:hypothetical protein
VQQQRAAGDQLMQPMTTLEASMLGGDTTPEEARPTTTITICVRGHMVQQDELRSDDGWRNVSQIWNCHITDE